MKHLNPIEKAKYIEDNFRKYIFSEFRFEEEIYQNQFKEELDNTNLLNGPYISKSLEFYPSQSLNELIDEGIVHQEFRKLNDIKINRKLRTHQETAIRRIHDGHNLIVTTGTGSGKTESFLYPIINEILHEEDINRPGVRAIFLFPMNALVNDQFSRVRKILNNYPKIKYGFFTGLTKDNEDDSIRDYIKATTGDDANINELRSRDEIRKNPPHILFTNFSMLEYILLRPKDNQLLDKKNTELWKFIVLDEAHVYKGALGIEVGMLLRRLQERIGHSVQFILTSATLGEENDEGIKKIKDFGYKLTSQTFENEDILFSKRIHLNILNSKYKVNPNKYLDLYNNLSENKIDDLLFEYNVLSNEKTIEGKLYDLIIGDQNLYLLNDELKKSMSFIELFNIFKENGFENINQLSSFIELVCKCMKNGLKIMDLRYHSFIRGINGAYITLGNDPKISLTPRSYIGKDRAFEIGVCKKCNSMYIIGIIDKEKNYLCQNNLIDIYANYSDTEPLEIDYFILEEQVKRNYIDPNNKELIAYQLCPRCGKIIEDNSNQIQLLKCEHDDVEKIKIYKIDNSESKVVNNLTLCHMCNGKDNHGVIHSVNMGKEATTALLTQIFFEAIDDGSIVEIDDKPIKSTLSLSMFRKNEIVKEEEKDNYSKQILSFSDSRQQASFAVKFAEYNHHRFLRKRLIVELLKINDYKTLSFESAVEKLDNIIRKLDLFDTAEKNDISSTKQAKITLLEEILNVDGINGGEGLGLFYCENDKLNELLADATDEIAQDFVSDLNINKKITINDLYCIMNAIIREFRNVPAITYEGLNQEDREKHFAYRMFFNAVTLKKPSGHIRNDKNFDISNSVKGLISKKSENKLEIYIKKVLGINRQQADNLIEKIYSVFVAAKIIEEYDVKNSLYTIPAKDFSFNSAKNCKWYYCNKCKKITRYNAGNFCSNCRTKGLLIECDPNEVLNNNFYRTKYIDKKIEKLVYKEHTAQLSARAAEERQLEFKKKKINFLSCSTTFEMGIDIGSLENVFLRNVPPAPANYVQRAGRAGRGQDTSAFVLTYCSPTSHDFTFFLDPTKMVDGVCATPVFTLQNYKIIIRHLFAVALSLFFKQNPHFIENVGSFYFGNGFNEFKKYLRSKPNDLKEMCNKILKSTDLLDLMDNKWIDGIFNGDIFNTNFEKSDENIKSIINELIDTKNKTLLSNEIEKIEKQINNILNDRNVISYLADTNLVPKYGFPTDLIELKVKDEEGFVNTSKYDLTRDMQIALSEYSPGSEVMVDKEVIVSKYVNKRSELLPYYYYECPKCGKTTVKIINNGLLKCKHCGYEDDDQEEKMRYKIGFVTPKYGFTGVLLHSGKENLKPKRSYSSPVKYIGNGTLVGEPIKIGDILEFYTVKNDEMLIVNESPFFTCRKCGFSIIDKEHEGAPYLKKDHKPLYGKSSHNCTEYLYPEKYGYSFKTDVLKMVVNIPISKNSHGISLLYAILEGIALSFDIERNDIDGIFINEDGKNILVLYDTVPGGAGHVKRLLNNNDMKQALKYAYNKVNQDCCDSACYNCIKNYKNQRHHRYLDRNAAKELLEIIIGDIDK